VTLTQPYGTVVTKLMPAPHTQTALLNEEIFQGMFGKPDSLSREPEWGNLPFRHDAGCRHVHCHVGSHATVVGHYATGSRG
jgi:hypothetical protein